MAKTHACVVPAQPRARAAGLKGGRLLQAARAEGLIMVTNGMKEFVRMPGGRVENWV